jgi:uncharacterized protein YcfJ
LRNTVLAAVASAVGLIGFQYINEIGTTFSDVLSGILANFIFFWCLRMPTAFLELYIAKRHSRSWILWPHGLATLVGLIYIASIEANPGRQPMFHHVVSIEAATVGLSFYLIFALLLMIPVSIAILVMNVSAKRTGTVNAYPVFEPVTALRQANKNSGIKFRIARLSRKPGRDAAALAVSIITAIAGLVQGLDVRDIGRTALALIAGTAGLYVLSKLPNVRQTDDDNASSQPSAVGKHSKPNPAETSEL